MKAKKKLYAVRDSKGRFKDIISMERAHRPDRKKKLTVVVPRMIDKDALIKELATETINVCKDKTYEHPIKSQSGRFAGNELEGDYGTWSDWEKVLIKFGTALLKQIK